MTRPWTEKEDAFLVDFGRAFGDGYAFIASHDFHRDPQEGRDRIEWLRTNKPEFVASVIARAEAMETEAEARIP